MFPITTTRGTAAFAPYAPWATSVASLLGRAFAEASRRDTPKSASDLHEATVSLVRQLKRDGLPPERVVVAIKDALTRYGGSRFPPSLLDGENALGEREATAYRHVFAWYLDTFYGANDRGREAAVARSAAPHAEGVEVVSRPG